MLSDNGIKDLLEEAKAGSLSNALRCYNKIIENVPPHPQYFYERSVVKMGLYRSELNQNDLLGSAIEDISKAIHLDPGRGQYYYKRGSYLWDRFRKTGNTLITDSLEMLKEIISDYKSCLSRTPTETDAWLDLIAINIISFNWDEAISLYGQCKLFTRDKVSQLYRSHLGCLAFIFASDTIEEEDIEPLHDQTIRLDNLISREHNICSFLIISHHMKNYKEKWNKVIEIEKIFISHYDDYYHRVKMFRTLRLDKEANVDEETAINEAIRINPDNNAAWRNKGIAFVSLGKYDEAINCFNESIRINPDNDTVWNIKGASLDKLGRYDEAIKCYDAALKINLENAGTWRSKGASLAKLGRYDEAIKCWDAAVKIDPGDANALINRFGALLKLKPDNNLHSNKRASFSKSKDTKNIKSNLFGRIKNMLTGGNK